MVMTPFVALYFISLGFSYFQISVIISVYGLSMLLFEIPTSAFADGFSRKYSVTLGFLIMAFTFALIPLTSDFYVILILHVMAGIGMTFTSGTEEAWVIDNLNTEGRTDLHQEYFIKQTSMAGLGAIFAPMIGAVIVSYYPMKLLWFVFAFGFFLNAVLTMVFTKEHYRPQKSKAVDLIKRSYNNSRMGLAFSIRHSVVFLSIMAALFTQLMFCGNIGNQKFLVDLGMPENQLGYLYSAMAGIGMITAFLSRFFVKFKPKNVMSVIIFTVMILLLSLSLLRPPLFIIACMIFILKDGTLRLGSPIYQSYLHTFIPGKIRASALSVNNMVSQTVIAVSSLAAGFFMDIYGPQKVLSVTGLFGVAAIFFYQRIKD